MLASSLLVTAHILVWHTYTGAEQRALEQAAASYSRRHPEVTVEPIAIPYGSFADKLQAAIPRGHGPDAFIYAHDLVGQWAAERLIQPLSAQPAVAACVPALWPKTVEPLLLRAPNASPDARPILYGVPLAFKSLALFYRTDLLRTPPSDTAALFAMAADRSRSPETTTPPYPLAYESGSFFYHAVWLHGLGGGVISPQSGRPTLDTPAQAAALRFVQRLQAQQVIPEDMSASLVARFFNEGHAASVISGPWFVGDIAAGVPYSVAPLPRVSETGLFAAPFTTVEAGFVSATAQKPSEAAAFLADLATGEAALLRLRTGRQAVTERAAWQDKAAIDDPILQAFFVQLPSLTPTPSHPGMRAFWEPGQQALRQALRGNEPVAALQAGQHLLDVYLAPALPAAAPMPYLLVVGLLLLGGAALLVARSRRMALWPQIVRNRSAYGYLAPSVLVLAMLGLFPLGMGAGLSLFSPLPDGSLRFVGLANYRDVLLCRPGGCLAPLSFYFTLLVTVLWTALNVAGHVILGVTLALLLRAPLLRLRGLYRMLLILPWAVPSYITALLWKGMFHRQFGTLNAILSSLGIPPVAWFSRFSTALFANITTNVWLGFPFMMVVALGHLAAIPADLEESAALDGASAWQRIRYIVLPWLGPAMLPSVLLGAVWTFNMFNVVFLVSGGEPDGQTEILISQAYRWAFSRGHQIGYAATYAVLIFLLLLLQTTLLRRASGADVDDQAP